MASALSAECESVLCQSRVSRGPGELKRSSQQRIQGIKGLIMVLNNLRWNKVLNTSFWKLFGLSQALVARIECALSTDCSERLGHSVLSAQLKLLHSVHSAAQCPGITVHSVLSAFENRLFQCRC